jgi:hypothetical protein
MTMMTPIPDFCEVRRDLYDGKRVQLGRFAATVYANRGASNINKQCAKVSEMVSDLPTEQRSVRDLYFGDVDGAARVLLATTGDQP